MRRLASVNFEFTLVVERSFALGEDGSFSLDVGLFQATPRA